MSKCHKYCGTLSIHFKDKQNAPENPSFDVTENITPCFIVWKTAEMHLKKEISVPHNSKDLIIKPGNKGDKNSPVITHNKLGTSGFAS